MRSVVAAVFYVLVMMSAAEAGKLDDPDWKVIVYTGSKIWAGTDSLVFVQVHGALGDSRLMQLTPTRLQMEARSVDTFPLPDLDAKHIGTIRSITVSKQHSYAFFNDWELLKVELVDPNEKVYLFNCKCWLTTLKNKQTLNLYAVNGIEVNKKGDVDRLAEMNRKTFRMLPVLVSLLFLMLVLIIFTYFGNMICKRWRLQYFNDSYRYRQRGRSRSSSERRRSGQRSSGSQSRIVNINRNNELFKEDDEHPRLPEPVYNYTNDLTNLNANVNRPNQVSYYENHQAPAGAQQNSPLILEDKPPEYKELFPMQIIASGQQTAEQKESTKFSSV